MTPSDANKITWSPPAVHRLIPIVMARRRSMILGAIAGMLVALAALAVTSQRYQINASLMLQLGREMGPPTTLGETPAMPVQKRPEDLATAVEMMSSQDLLEHVVDSFGEDYFYARPPAVTTMQKARRFASDLLQSASDKASEATAAITGKRKLTRLQKVVVAAEKDLTIEVARRSDVVDITYISSDPDQGKEFLAKFIEMYRDAHLRAYQTPKARNFFVDERDRLETRLNNAEASMAKFKAEHDAFSGDDQLRFMLQQQQGMSTAYAALQSDVVRMDAQVIRLKQALAQQPAELQVQAMKQRNTLLDVLRAKLAEAEADQARIHSKYSDDSRTAHDADQEVATLREQLGRADKDAFVTGTVTTGLNETHTAIETELLKQESDLDGLKAQAALQKQQLDALSVKLRDVDNADAELNRRAREIQLLTEAYRLSSKNLEDATISEAMDRASISNIAVIEPPTASPVPVYPPTKLWFMAAIVLGAALPLAVGIAGDALRPTVQTRSDIQQSLGAPTLARVPEIEHLNGTGALDGDPAVAEEFTRLCAELRTTYSSAKTILVTAVRAGDGTTRVAAAIARGLARDHHCRTALVDANLAHPTLHGTYGLPLAGGLGDAGDSVPVIKPTNVPGLMVVTAGEKESATAADVTASVTALIGDGDYDMIIIDAAAVTQSAITRAILPRVDGVLLVVEAYRTRLSELAWTQEVLSRAGAKLLGAVMNRNGRFLPRRLRGELERSV